MKVKSLALLMCFFALNSHAQVIGVIDSATLSTDKQNVAVSGWACDRGVSKSIAVHLYAGGQAGASGAQIVTAMTASQTSEAGVTKACGTTGVNHRFRFNVGIDTYKPLMGKSIFIHGISTASKGNLLLDNSGKFKFPTVALEVKGNVDGIALSSDQQTATIRGWACDYGRPKSINVHLYSGGKAGEGGRMLKSVAANVASESGVSEACGTSGVRHRFTIPISRTELIKEAGNGIFVHGISASNGQNLLIGNSGKLVFPSVNVNLSELSRDGNNNLVIGKGQKVIINQNANLRYLDIKGELHCSTDKKNYTLTVQGISVYGKFVCGSSGSRFGGKLDIRIRDGLKLEGNHGSLGNRSFLVHSGGEIHFYGEKKTDEWLRLKNGRSAKVGVQYLDLEKAVNWKVGDEIAITSTGFSMEEAERFTITSLSQSNTRVHLNKALKYEHHAIVEQYQQGQQKWTLDQRAKVVNLTRNIRMYAYDGNHGATKLGAHLMVMIGGKAYVDSVEFFHMGRQGEMARYPFHWHNVGNGNGQFIRNSSIHDTYQRCVTVHGTNNTRVQNNICYEHIGHGYFLEDGNEVGNIIEGNIGFSSRAVKKEKSLLMSDVIGAGVADRFPTPSTYWISHPRNTVRNNIAAGSQGTGFWMAFEDRVIASIDTSVAATNPIITDTGIFDNNVAHSSMVGITWDGAPGSTKISNPNNREDKELVSAHYRPQKKPVFNNLVAFKNTRTGIYFRGDAATFNNAVMADNRWSIFVAFSQHFKNTLVVGKSKAFSATDEATFNKLNVTGAVLYDGPFELENVSFQGFPAIRDQKIGVNPAPLRIIGGANRYENKVKGLSFNPEPWTRVDFSDVNTIAWIDSPYTTSLRDLDGTLTGTRGRIVVPYNLFNNHSSCVRNQLWNAYVCDYEVGMFFFSGVGNNPNLANFNATSPSGGKVYYNLDSYKKMPVIYQNKMQVILGSTGTYVVEAKESFANDNEYTVFFMAEKLGASSPVLEIRSSRTNCFGNGIPKYDSLNDLSKAREGYYTFGRSIYLKARTTRVEDISKNSEFSLSHRGHVVVKCN